jgi:hypothetical protein
MKTTLNPAILLLAKSSPLSKLEISPESRAPQLDNCHLPRPQAHLLGKSYRILQINATFTISTARASTEIITEIQR